LEDFNLGAILGSLVVLLALSAFFSGSETALMTLNRYRLRHLAREGNRGARRAEALLKRPDRLIGLILIGNNFVNNLAASLAAVVALEIGGEGSVAIAATAITILILIFSEVAPKTLGALHPERVAFPAATIYGPLMRVFYPIVWGINGIVNGLLRLLGVDPQARGTNALSREELRTVISEAGALVPRRHAMMVSILDLEDTTVEDIMITRNDVDGIDIDDPLDDILESLRKTQYTRIPVWQGSIDHVVGVLHVRPLLQTLMTEGEITKDQLRTLLREPYYIPEGTPLHTQMINFQRAKETVGLVVDEYGDVLGLVTLFDLLEEIVGEFTTDPFDSIREVQPQADGSFLVSGGASVRDLVRTMRWELPTDGPKTLNGLILEQLESIPDTGTSLLINRYPVEVLQVQDNAVRVARIYPARRRPAEANAED
jgi:Mg2+/Co2+ transporter CorB